MIFIAYSHKLHSQACDSITPSFVVDLSSDPDSVWISPSIQRDGLCCNALSPDVCIEFYITLHPSVAGIYLDIYSGASPAGSMFYMLNCDSTTITAVGDSMCLDGQGPHRITFCKPGNNPNTYIISGIGSGEISDPIIVSDACTDTLFAIGFTESSIVWTSIPPDSTYNSFLSCTTGCDTVIVTPWGSFPDSVMYKVCGDPAGLSCSGTTTKCDSTTVYFIFSLGTQITPQNPSICFGGPGVTLYANATGGKPPYSYLWSTGGSGDSIIVTSGNGGDYWVEVWDSTGCPSARDTVTVIEFTASITAEAGPNDTVCSTDPTTTLSGSVTGVTTGTWTGGSGTFSPGCDSLNTGYTPSAGEIAAGSITLMLTTTNTGSCPADSDTIVIIIENPPTADAGPDKIVCADTAGITLSGTVTNSTGGVWNTSGSGIFSPDANSLTATYIPSAADTAAGSVVIVLTTTGNTGCTPVTDTMIITITPAPTVYSGPDQTVCANEGSASLSGAVTIAIGGEWSTSGSGTFFPDVNNLNADYIFSNADTAAGSVTIFLTTIGNGNCKATTDTMLIAITPAPTADAGPDQTVCADIIGVSLEGAVTVATGGTWTTSGSGTFSPDVNTLNAIYQPSNADTAAGSVTLTLTTTGIGTCIPVSDDMIITITPAPTANAGPDTTICSDVDSVQLNGSFTIATGGTWSTTGSGTFSPNVNTLDAIYIPSDADTVAGSVTLVLTTTGNGTCNPVADNMAITFTPTPTVDAGFDQTVCANNNSVSLSGSVTIASGGIWTTNGSGIFDSPNLLNATYTPSDADTAAGTVILTLTSTGNGTCNAVSDDMVVTITPAPTVFAGDDTTVCDNYPAISLNGIVATSTGGTWSTSGLGTFSPDDTTLNANYIFHPNDITNGTVTLTLISTGNGDCISVSDDIVITIPPGPIVDAGPDQNVCAVDSIAILSGSVTNAAGGIWTSLTGGTFSPSDTILNTTYILSATDLSSPTGTVTLILTSTGNGNCDAVSDSMLITITPTVNAGADQLVCNNADTVQLNGSVSNSTSAQWSTSGTGTFSPDQNTLNAGYIVTASDIAGGTITLTLTATGAGTCPATSDSMIITFIPPATANAGPDTTVCIDTSGVILSGSITNSSGATWTSSGSGIFNPSPDSLNTTYIPDSTGTDTLVLTAVGSCNNASDTMILYITLAGLVDAGTDQAICIDDTTVNLSGTVYDVPGATWSTTGTGYFIPDDTTLMATYIISSTDSAVGIVTLILTADTATCNTPVDSMVVTILPPPVIDAGTDDTVCANNADVVLSATIDTGGVPGVLWTSSGTGIFIPESSTLNATYIPSDNDTAVGTVTLTLTTVGSCFDVSDSLTVTITPAPAADAGLDQTVCRTNPNVILNGNVSIANSGVWTTSGSGTFADSSDLNTTYIPSSADTTVGNVTITLTTTGNGLCIPVSDSLVITYTPNQISVDVGPDQTVCQNEIVYLNGVVNIATGGIWSTSGSGIFSPSDTVLDPDYILGLTDTGTVTLILETTSNGGCPSKTDSLIITILDSIQVFASTNDDTVCANSGPIQLNGIVINAPGGIWSTSGSGNFIPNNTSLNPSYLPSAIDILLGSVYLALTSTGGSCNPLSDTISITIIPAPIADFSFTDVCFNDLMTFNDSSTPSADIVMWDWDFGDTTMDTTQNPVHLYGFDGYHTVSLIVTSNNGCTDTVTKFVLTHPLPVAGFSSTAECFVDSAYFTDSSTVDIDSIISWYWTFGDGGFDTIRNPAHLYASEGIYIVSLTIVSSFGCTDNITDSLNVSPGPVAGFTFTNACFPDPIVFIDTSTISSSISPHWIVSWTWDFGDSTSDTIQDPPPHYYSSAGINIITLIVVSEKGCIDSVSMPAPLHPKPSADFIFENICEVDSMNFTDLSSVISPDSIISWTWYFGDGNSSSIQSPSHSYSTYGFYPVDLIVSTNQGCLDTISKVTTVSPSPDARFSVDNNIVSTDENINFTDQSTGSSALPDTIQLDSWQWDFYYPAYGSADSTSAIQNPYNNYSDTGMFIVQLIVMNEYLCTDTIYDSILVHLNPLVPSGFSPDGNGKNDILYIEGGPYAELDFIIYNEWGEKIFVSKKQENGWDGTYKGKPQPIGVYVYTVIAKAIDGKEYKLWGDVTLLR
ncbi:MAG: PKD domain-containing protein [Bacteroidota bacterium]